ncbi:peptidase [Halobaculum sp. P14]|uniref:peptidase n=1 Tax=Halobaculum sp. P14 TaxID=3421638 RepID=UPI003EB6E15A
MLPLQSASTPALGPPVAFWLALCVVAVVAGAVGSAVARRLSNPVGKYRLLYLGVVFPIGLLAYGLLAVLDFGTAVTGALLPGVAARSGLVAALAADFATWLAAAVAVLAAYAPTIRGVRAVRDIDLSTASAVRRMARYLLGVAALLTVLIVPLRRVVAGGAGLVPLAVLLVGVAAVVLVASPWVITALRDTREPTAAEADRLAALRERAGLSVRDTVVLAETDAESATLVVRGPPGYRRLFVSDAFLDAFDDDTAAALLASKAAQGSVHVLGRRIGTVVAAGVLLIAAFGGDGGLSVVPLAGAAAALLVGLWATRRGIRSADDAAADRVGAAVLADAFERYADAHSLVPSRRSVPNPLSANVPLGDRIDRLRDRAADGDGGGNGDGSGDDGGDVSHGGDA